MRMLVSASPPPHQTAFPWQGPWAGPGGDKVRGHDNHSGMGLRAWVF